MVPCVHDPPFSINFVFLYNTITSQECHPSVSPAGGIAYLKLHASVCDAHDRLQLPDISLNNIVHVKTPRAVL